MKNIKSKLKILISVVLAVSLVLGYFSFFNKTETAQATWWDEKWHYRKAITINHNQVTADLTNFPMLVSLTDSDLGAHAQEDGDDIIFVTKQGERLKHEIESYDNSTGVLVAWVKIPELSSTQDEDMYMYYGNASVSDQSDGENVWDENYVTVHHMASSSSATRFDSTSNSHDGTMDDYDGNEATTTAKINGADSYDGADDILLIDDHDDLTDMTALTLSSWVKFDQIPSVAGSPADMIHKRHEDDPYYSYRLLVNSSNIPQFYTVNESSNAPNVYANTAVATNTWYYIVGTWDGNDMLIYVNGVEDNDTTNTQIGNIYNSSYTLRINYNAFGDGIIDEMRISNNARSADWIQTEYNNQNNPDLFLSPQDEEVGKGPVGYWTFDRGFGTTAYDESGQGNVGTITGATWQEENMCISGRCLYFDGSSDYVNAGTGINSEAITVSAWVRTTSSTDYQMIVDSRETNNSGVLLDYGYGSNDVLTFTINNSQYAEVDSGLQANTWYHIVGTYDPDLASDNIKIYIDGDLKDTTNYTTAISGISRTTIIGSHYSEGSVFWDGYIDEVKIYPYARSANEVKADYNAGLAGVKSNKGISVAFGGNSSGKSLTDGLVGYWKMDESATTSGAIDSSGNGLTGIYEGNASTTAGKFGNGGIFATSSGDNINIGDIDKLESIWEFSVSFWIKDDTGSNDEDTSAYLVSQWGSGGTDVFRVEYDTSENLEFHVRDSDDGSYGTQIDDAILDTEWHHIVGVKYKTHITIYLDGALGSTISMNDVTDESTHNLIIASRNGAANYYSGQIDEVRVYNRALSQNEVTKLYEWAPGPVLHLKMDEKTGQTAYDSAVSTTMSGGHHGTLGSSASADSADPIWNRGKYGSALRFDGIDDYVSAATSSAVENLKQITIAAWVKPNTVESNDTIFSKNNVGNFTKALQFRGSNDLRFFVNTSGTDLRVYSNSNAILPNVWQHVAISWNGGLNQTDTEVYINGVPDREDGGGTDGTGSILFGSKDIIIGETAGYSNYEFDGLMDDFKIYNYVRTQKQILEDMSGGGPAISQKVLHLKFDEGRGATAYDSSGRGNPGTVTPDSGGSNTTVSEMWDKNGKFKGAIEFDGEDDYVRITDASMLDFETNNFSVSAWIYPKSASDSRVVDKRGRGASYQGWQLKIDGDSGQWGIKDSTIVDDGYDYVGCSSVFCGSNRYNYNSWHQITMIFDNDNDKAMFFVDAEKIYETTSVTTVDDGAIGSTSNAIDVIVGASVYLNGSPESSQQLFDGLIDEVKIYSYALTEDEIKLDYNQGKIASIGSVSTASSTESASAANREYCVPGDTAQCSPPVFEMKFDEKTGVTAYDSSGNGNDGTLTWMSTSTNGGWTRGKYGSALDFDGTDDYLANDSDVLALISEYTISGWIKRDVGASGGYIFYAGTRPYLYDNGTGSYIRFKSEDQNVDSGNLNDNQWYNFSVSNDGVDSKMYIDGICITSASEAVGTNDKFYLGSDLSDYFDGQIDDVRVYDYVRTPAQIAWDYNKGKPVAHYKFDECRGGTIYDSSGHGNHGQLYLGTGGDQTATGTCASSSDSSFWWNGRTGKKKSAGSFDGTDDYIKVNDSASLDIEGAISISVWFNPDNDDTTGHFVNKGIASGWDPQNYMFYTYGDTVEGALEFDFHNGFWRDTVTPANTIVVGIWQHAVATQDGSNTKIYLNGELIVSDTETTAPEANSDPLWIGGTSSSFPFDGMLDELKIFNYALTPQQIREDFNMGTVRFGN